MAAYEVLLLNTAIPQIQAAQSGDTYVVPRDIAFSTVASLAAGTEALPSLVATGDVNTGFWFPAADTIAASTGGTRRLTLTSNGDLGVGTTSPRVRAEFAGIDSGFYAGAGIYVAAAQGSSNWVGLGQYSHLIGGGGSTNAVLINNGAGYFSIYNNGGERARITSTGEFQWKPDGTTQAMTLDASGNLLVGTTSTANKHKIVGSGSNVWALVVQNNDASSPQGQVLQYESASPNNTGNSFLYCGDNTALRAEIRSNGGLANYSANNVNLSDRREKTNFAPAKNYLDIICAIPVQTFNYIDQNRETDDGLTLGVVAQDVQAVAPELVMESNWGTEEEPKMRLSIYQTDLQYALMKCIQEQQEIINDLRARVAQLEQGA